MIRCRRYELVPKTNKYRPYTAEKMKPRKLAIHAKTQTALLALIMMLIGQTALAHNKVVVIPMAGDDIPAISHPVATTVTNSIGMQFNELPAGSFTMGSPVNEPGRYGVESEHMVTLTKAFKMQITEVTNAQWNDVIVDSALGANPSTSNPGDNTHPVENVNWYDALYFANRLSLDEGRSVCYTFSGVSGTPGSGAFAITTVSQNTSCTGYRLATEAEWEYAARAGTTKAYANPIMFDDSDTQTNDGFNRNLHAMGWYSYNDEMENASGVTAYGQGTKPVAQKQANSWGLYDMHGNVFEWNWDAYEPYSGDVTDPSGPASGDDRVIRGGAWNSIARATRSGYRNNYFLSSRANHIGFRLVLSHVQ